MITQLPGGWLATKFGGKYVFGVSVLVSSLLTLITPLMAYLNLWALVACRVATGFFEVSGNYKPYLYLYVYKTAGNYNSRHKCNVWKVDTTIGKKYNGDYFCCR